MKGMLDDAEGKMKPDLTRWNRAGLKRFRYVDGNAATYLEALRQELSVRLADWGVELLGFKLDGNTPEERQENLEEDYIEQFVEGHQQALANYLKLNDNRGSIAFEMIRSFVRAAHVLTGHLDAYANEGYLGTATQWENVRRLVHGLDYHPNPPASAMTYLVLQAKPGQGGLVASGLQVKYTPENGSPVVFETLEDIQVNPALNALRLEGWNDSQGEDNKLNMQESRPVSELELDRIVEGLEIGDPVIIENAKGILQPRLLNKIEINNGSTVLTLNSPVSISGRLSDLLVHLKPTETLEIFEPIKGQTINIGASSLILEVIPAQLLQDLEDLKKREDPKNESDYIYVFIGNSNTGVYQKVSRVNEKEIFLDTNFPENDLMNLDLSKSDCFVGIPEKLKRLGSGNNIYVIDGMPWPKENSINALAYIKTEDKFIACTISRSNPDTLEVKKADYEDLKIVSDKESVIINVTRLFLDFVAPSPALSEITKIWIPPSGNQWKWKIDRFVDIDKVAYESLLEVSTVKRIASGDLCVVACGNNLMAARVEKIKSEKMATHSELIMGNWQLANFDEEIGEFIHTQTTVVGKFKEQVHLNGWDANGEPVSGNKLTPEDKDAAECLKKGQPIVVEQETPTRQSFQTQVQGVVKDEETGAVTVELASDMPKGYLVSNTVIRANVVRAGHGETQPERILGSGNATLSNQEFVFPISNVSFVPDETQVSGVKADITVTVDGEKWTQVARFNQSRPTDLHYAVRMTEEGHLRIVFGDGVNGRRLPSGENNVRIAWRLGSGLAGNLEAGSLTKLARPHPRVEAVAQPFRSSGGNDMESVTSLRRSAPASLLTMERAVSVNDFATLAASHSSVWNARAELQSLGSFQVVRIAVVPAQGEELSDGLSETIKAFLLSHAIPGVHIELKGFHPEPLKLGITIAVDSARFELEAVKAEVMEILPQRFALKNRNIGAPVYLSDVYQCVEAVRGVKYSTCKFVEVDENGEIVINEENDTPVTTNEQVRYPRDPDGVLYMKDEKDIFISAEETQK